jgi:peptidoglycan/LPS O-acetylase OafA/YrhL
MQDVRVKKSSSPVNPGKVAHRQYIDALRGLAALGVLVVHNLLFFPNLPWRAKQLANLGTHGVQLFFMVSAITLASSWHARHGEPVRRFFIRRFFRIAPMFWMALLGYLALGLFVNPIWKSETVSLLAVFHTFIFAHGWSPKTINAVVPGGWSIADEMAFYLMFPALMAIVTTLPRALGFFAISILVALCSNEVAAHVFDPAAQGFGKFVYYWLPNQLPIFSLGLITFFLIPHVAAWRPATSFFTSIFGLAVLIALALAPLPYTATIAHPSIWRDLVAGFGFLALILSFAARPWTLFVNRFTRHLGKVSFSSYLLQFAVLQLAWSLSGGHTQIAGVPAILLFSASACLLVTLNISLASITYRAIEKPFIRIGHRLADGGISLSVDRGILLPSSTGHPAR